MEAALSERSDARRYLGPLGFPTSSCEGRATRSPLDLVAGEWRLLKVGVTANAARGELLQTRLSISAARRMPAERWMTVPVSFQTGR
jgi:hypothetical protein